MKIFYDSDSRAGQLRLNGLKQTRQDAPFRPIFPKRILSRATAENFQHFFVEPKELIRSSIGMLQSVDRPQPLVSFAQNAEDVVLARAFQPWLHSGSWVDVGAGHPKYDSVTHLFSEYGWRGMNIEPQESDYRLLCELRPRDVNIRCAITQSSGEVELFIGPEDSRGSSTLVSAYAAREDAIPWQVERVIGRPLQDLLDQHDVTAVDFLKIDVEGSELEVLKSIDFSRFRAKCVVVEATLPNTQIPSHHEWEPLLLAAGYQFVLFDGLNRFYFHHSENHIGEFLASPACVFDDYVRALEVEQLEQLRIQLSNSMRESDLLRVAKDQSDTYAKSLETWRTETSSYIETLHTRIEELARKLDQLENDVPHFRSEM